MLKSKSMTLAFVSLAFVIGTQSVFGGVDIIEGSKVNPKDLTAGPPVFSIKNNTPFGWELGGFRFWTDDKEYPITQYDLQKVKYRLHNGDKYHDGVWSTKAWDKTLGPGQEKLVTFTPLQWGRPIEDQGHDPIPLLKTGVCNEPAPYQDADPITLEELADLMENPLYYDENHRYLDKMGTNGGAVSGGWIDTYYGQTQMQLVVPTGTINVNGTDAEYNTDMFNTPMSFMALTMGQEFFGMDQQWLFSVWSKETAFSLMRNSGTVNWHKELWENSEGAFGPGEVEATTYVSRAMGYPKFFPYDTCMIKTDKNGDGYPEIRDVATYSAICGESDIQFVSRYMGADHTDPASAKIVNALFGSGLTFWFNYDLLANATDLRFKQALDHSNEGGDPWVGLCAMTPLYNLGINSGAEAALNGDPTALTCNDFPTGNGNYRVQITEVAKKWEEMSMKAQTDNSIELVDKWLTLDDIRKFYFGEDSDPNQPWTANGLTQDGGLMKHFNIGEDQAKNMWKDIEKAFNMQAAHWGGGKISLRYDWLSNLRIAKSYLDLDRGKIQGEEASQWIENHSTKPSSYDGRTLDNTYPFMKLTAIPASDDQGFAVEVQTEETEADDWGVALVEWTFKSDWSHFTDRKVEFAGGTPMKGKFKIDLSTSDLAPLGDEGGTLYVRVTDSCGNSVVRWTPIEGVKLPKLTDAWIVDTDGDGNGDKIFVNTLEEDIDELTVRLHQKEKLTYSWPDGESPIESSVNLSGTQYIIEDKSLKGGAVVGLGGRVVVYLPGGYELKADIRDSVAPVIKFASVQEDYLDELYVLFSEDIKDPGAGSYLEINGAAVAITTATKEEKIWKFKLASALSKADLEALKDSVRIVPGALTDGLGNPAHNLNPKVAIVLDKGPLQLAAEGSMFLDRDGDGTLDRVQLAFTQPAIGRTGTMTLTFKWPKDGDRPEVQEFSVKSEDLEVDVNDPTLVYYDVTIDSLLPYATYFDLEEDEWGKTTLFQKSMTPAIPDQTDDVNMQDGMGPVIKTAEYGESRYPSRRPDTLTVLFSERIDTNTDVLFDDALYLYKAAGQTPVQYPHQSPSEKKRVRKQGHQMAVYFTPDDHKERPGIGDSIRIAFEEDLGVIRDMSGNKATSINPWAILTGKLRTQIIPGEKWDIPFDASDTVTKDTIMFFENTFNLDSLVKVSPGVGFAISFQDSAGETDRSDQKFFFNVRYFTNHGTFVSQNIEDIDCNKMQEVEGNMLTVACDPSKYAASRKIKVFIPWNARSETGARVGSGAYIQQVHVGGSRIDDLELVRTIGILRVGQTGETK